MSTIVSPESTDTIPALSAGSKTNSYTLQGHLEGHMGLVLCMSITEDGKLASGGMDGVRIWDLRNMMGKHTTQSWKAHASQFSRPSGAGDRGATTALAWIRREDEPDDGLIYGTASGLIICWREVAISGRKTAYEESFCVRMANPSEITAIAFESGSNRLAVANRHSVVSIFRVGPKIDLHPVFSVVIKDHVPKALAFGQSGEEKDIHTFGLYDGAIYTLSGKDGKIEDSRQTGCKIGNVSANLRRGVFCVDDPSQGVALYRYHSWDRIRTYPVTIEKSMRPRQVSFVEDCKFILSGSDHGVVYIFDRRSGKMVDELKSGTGRIQSLTATEHSEKPLIFSAMSYGADESCSISVWQRNIDVADKKIQRAAELQPETSTWVTLINTMVQVCFIVMALGFLWQNTSMFSGFKEI